MNHSFILESLAEQGLISEDAVGEVAFEIAQTGLSLAKVLEKQNLMTEDQFHLTIAQMIGTEAVSLNGFVPPQELLDMLPVGLAQLHRAVPVGWDGNSLQVALDDPFHHQSVEDLRFALGFDVHLVIAPVDEVAELLRNHYSRGADELKAVLSQMDGDDMGSETEVLNDAPIIKYVDLVMQQAIVDRASDIHFEPFEHDFKIRYRVDGALYEMAPPPRHLASSIISRVKVMANLNIAERRLPQDGRIQREVNGRSVDMRVSTLPTQFGESVVLRVLDRSSVNLSLEALGLPQPIYNYLMRTVELPNGIFIVTGPTGSGKTTTLYACLEKINTIDAKVLTAEDPVEFDIDGIIQVPINEGMGLTFARVLRAFLRQDPDRIMVGETRDVETAQIAIQASLTGHLVLTTLHTNDAPGAVTRLIDMGVEPFMISAALEGVLGQRLIRKVCTHCRTAYEPTEAVLSQLGLSPHEIGDKQFYYGAGCVHCNSTGYRGRKGIYELLDVTEPIRELINQRAPSLVLKQKAIELGMTTLRDDGLRLIYDGETSIEEILKYT
ncbi:MAG: type II/IV secretion system protein [Proteobacteria bacterium]|nr:type II/IV secretion system protein [Pseudomonadota bacterium]